MIPFHLIAFVLGSILDLLIGDPHSIPHPVQLIGKLIAVLDRKLQARAERKAGRADSANVAGNAKQSGKIDIEKNAWRPAGINAEEKQLTGTNAKGNHVADGATEHVNLHRGTYPANADALHGATEHINLHEETYAENAKEDAAENSRYKADIPDERHPKEKVRILKRRYGRWMAAIVVLVTAGVAALILLAGYRIHPILGCALEAVMTCQILAGRSLEKESMKVYACLQNGRNAGNVPSEKHSIRWHPLRHLRHHVKDGAASQKYDEVTESIAVRRCDGEETENIAAQEQDHDANLQAARRAVAMIVGRDTEHLSAEQVVKAAVETVAESTSDGVIAPMLYTALGGPVLGWAYKAVNTMDSMVGYKNERYLDFGRGPAHLDDVANYLPSRISALLMIAAAWILSFLHLSGRLHFSKRKNSDTRQDYSAAGTRENHMSGYHGFDAANAWRIWKRDRRSHASPNAAQTESVMAGALRVQLAGPAFYGGKLVKKPYIGDPLRKIETEDIPRANQLMFGTAVLCALICIGLMQFSPDPFSHISRLF